MKLRYKVERVKSILRKSTSTTVDPIYSLSAVFGVTQAMDTNMIGRMPTTFNNAPIDTSRLSGLFLNTNDSSPYSGNVIAWDFCYYISVTQSSMITIQAGVWRESDGYYTLVNDSLIDLPIPEPQPGFQFVCRHWAECQAFEVQEGDIVGMYVNDTSDDNMVHILGMPPDEETNVGTKKIRSMNITDVNIVSKSALESVGYSLYLVAVLGIYTVVYAILVATFTYHCQCSVVQVMGVR